MKQMFAFLLLVATAMLLITLISGIGGVFTAIASTWGIAQTTQIATVLSQVFYFAGIVIISTLGFALFNATTKSSKLFGGSRANQNQQYQVIDGVYQQVPMIENKPDDMEDWYKFDEQEKTLY